MLKINKGEYGYIKNKKSKLIIYLILVIVIALGIFFTGFVLSEYSKKNIFSVIAMLFVLPGAKILTSLIVVWPHKGLNLEQYQLISKVGREGMLYDMVLTSPDKVMYIKAMAILTDKYVIMPCDKQDDNYIKTYIEKHLYNYGFEKEIVITNEFNEFRSLVVEENIEDKEYIEQVINKLMILQI